MKKLIEILTEDPILNSPLTGTDKNTVHNYINGFYEDEFLKFNDRQINLLEVGIYHGGSLFLWEKYFKNVNIYGVDITDAEILDRYKNIKNTKQIFENAYDETFAKQLPNFDIAIDDGPHTLESQIKFIEIYLPKINPGGVLIIEDVQNYDYLNILDNFVPNELKNNIRHIDLRKTINRFDDIIFAINK